MRIQFTVTDGEFGAVARAAAEKGYPNVAAYCRDCVLDRSGASRDASFPDLWESVQRKVAALPAGAEFALRDLVPNPPSVLGTNLFRAQGALGIEYVKKDRDFGSNVYRKL